MCIRDSVYCVAGETADLLGHDQVDLSQLRRVEHFIELHALVGRDVYKRQGMGYFGPMRYSELPRFYRDGNATTDVAMIQVTPMDAHGNFSFAVSASHIGDMLEHAKKIIVEVNQNMPWVYGLTGTEINIRDVDMVVEGENPAVAAMGAGTPPTDVDRKVAEMIVKEIPNGACLQLGIGGMPNTVGSLIAESDLKDLGCLLYTSRCV